MGLGVSCTCACTSRPGLLKVDLDLEATSDSSSENANNSLDPVSVNQPIDPKPLWKDLPERVSFDNVGQETQAHDLESEFKTLVTMCIHICKPSQCDTPKSLSNTSLTYHSYVAVPLTQVLPRLYLGTQEDVEQEESILQLGVTHIISIVGGGRYSHICKKHMYIPLRDNGSSDLIAELDRSYDFMLESQKPGNKLFIHCHLGQNRSASFVIGFLMRYRKWCLYQSYTFLKDKRKIIHPHHNYIKQLRELDLKLNNVYSTPENFLQLSICPSGKLNIQHEDFSDRMSIEYKRHQTEEILMEKRRQSVLPLKDCTVLKKSGPSIWNKTGRSSVTNVPLTNLADIDSLHRSFTISRTNAPKTGIRISTMRSRNLPDAVL